MIIYQRCYKKNQNYIQILKNCTRENAINKDALLFILKTLLVNLLQHST